MSERNQVFAIVGAGLAGAKAGEELREAGFEGRVVLIGEEVERPYERPPLSKDYLRGELSREKIFVHDEAFYGEREIELMAGRAAREIDAAAQEVVLTDGERLPFDRLLLATGAEPRRLEIRIEAFEGADALERVATTDGRTVECDFAIVGIGVRPRTELAEAAGLAVDDGVLVDAELRTSHPAIFAAGDIARQRHPTLGALRVEHWANALAQGPAAARNMLGRGEPYERVPYFFSDQYDVGMEYAGLARRWDRVVFRGDPASRELIAFWLRDGYLLAGMNVNVWDVNEQLQELASARTPVAVAALEDPEVALGDLASVQRIEDALPRHPTRPASEPDRFDLAEPISLERTEVVESRNATHLRLRVLG
jgi:NADPH-dependent 2,4-dienoyl-CoA reductase/sulfur reductase-like enzyme